MLRTLNNTIHADALRHNLTIARQFAKNSKIMVAVKSNAYGHGMELVADVLSEADGFAVATIEEGVRLRVSGVEQPILVLTGAKNTQEYQQASGHALSLCIHHPSQLSLISKHTGYHPDIWLMFDTGMHRLGFSRNEIPRVIDTIGDRIKVLMTHFSDADNPGNQKTQDQINCFNELANNYSYKKSLANSAAILSRSDCHMDWVRPGIMIYGSSPLQNRTAEELSLQPAMTLKATLISVQTISAGERIGYGGDYTCREDMPIGVVSIGYGDGYPRHARSGTPVLVNGKLCEMAGRVSMDMLTIDLRNCPNARVGSDVMLWGQGLSADTVANCADTIAYELLCSIGRGR